MTEQTNTAAIKALCKAQAAMPKAVKDSDNPFFNKKYESLAAVQDACLPYLHSNGFAVMHHTGRDDDGRYLETTLLHESGERFSCRIPLIVDKNNMQGFKSAVTYARRIGLGCVSGVAPEDDDGNSAAENPPKRGNGSRVIDNDPPTTNQATLNEIAIENMEACETLDALGHYWKGLHDATRADPDVLAAKDRMKSKLQGSEAA